MAKPKLIFKQARPPHGRIRRMAPSPPAEACTRSDRGGDPPRPARHPQHRRTPMQIAPAGLVLIDPCDQHAPSRAVPKVERRDAIELRNFTESSKRMRGRMLTLPGLFLSRTNFYRQGV